MPETEQRAERDRLERDVMTLMPGDLVARALSRMSDEDLRALIRDVRAQMARYAAAGFTEEG